MSNQSYKNNSQVTPEKLEAAYKRYMSCKNYAPTGSLLLDLNVGGGIGLGFPYGYMVNIVGDKSTGKTLLGWELIAANFYKYKKDLKYNYDGAEAGDTFDTSQLYGVNFNEHEQNFGQTSELVENFDGNTSLFLDWLKRANHRGIYLLDSLDGLSDKDKAKQALVLKTKQKEINKRAEKGLPPKEEPKEGGSYNVGTAAHLSKQYFKEKAGQLLRKKALLYIISQVRCKMDAKAFGKKFDRSGGKAMDFYAHTCLWLYNVGKIKKNGKTIGLLIRALTDKSKTPRPYRDCTISVYFDYGIDNIGSCIDYLYECRGDDNKLNGKAKTIPWYGDGEVRTFKKTVAWLKEFEPELYTSLKALKKEETDRANLSTEWLEEQEETNEEFKKKVIEKFGETISRDELIDLCEDSDKAYKELEKRVIYKWEAAEIAVKSDRKRKYS